MINSKNFMSGNTNVLSDISLSSESTDIWISGTAADIANSTKGKITSFKDTINNSTTGKQLSNGSINDTHPLSHNENNIVPNSNDFSLQFSSNILDNYDVYTYHWKFFITSLEDATSGNVLNLSAQTIIAESGVSDLTIDHVELHGIAVPSIEAGTGTQTLIKFEIIEPSGAGLLDKMYFQSLALGIGNWLVMPTFLQLEFRGRDPVTVESVISGASSELASLKWVWPIKLTNAKANVTNVGTKYEFDAIMYDELAQSNSYFSIQHNVVLQGLTTFEQAMKDLENKLNADQIEKLIDNYSIPDTYTIHVDPAFANKPITLSDQHKNTSRSSDFVDFVKKTASFNAGTGIDKIIDALCGSMDYFQTKMQNSPTRAAQPNSSTAETNQMKSLWRVITETKPIAYDLLRQDNAVAVTIYIVEYDLGMVDVNPSQTGQTPEALAAEKRRFVEYAQKKIMKKKYNYIFTGLNDQIKNLDLNMNFAFAASLSRFGGIYYDSAVSDRGVTAQQNSENQKNVSEQLRQTLQFINSATNGDDITTKVKTTQDAINNANIDPILAARYTNILNYAKSPDKKAYASQIIENGGLSSSGTLSQQVTKARSIATPVSGTNSNGDNINLTFVSDVNINSPAAKSAESNLINLRKGKLRPIPYRENMQEIMLAGGIDPTSDAARSRVSSVFATALYSTLDASLQVLKLTIKGDPYWLFPRPVGAGLSVLPYKSNMSPSDAIADIKNSHISNPDTVNLFGTDNFIVIRFRTPRIYNITSDQEVDPFTEVNAFSGVYKVITIINKFEMGVFTQELSCILDPVIDLQDFLKAMEDDSGKSADVTPQENTTVIPPNSIKTDKIMGSTDDLKGQVATIKNQLGNITNLSKNIIGQATGSVTSNIPVLTNITPGQALAQLNSTIGRG